jgi:hypothetical protein
MLRKFILYRLCFRSGVNTKTQSSLYKIFYVVPLCRRVFVFTINNSCYAGS